MFIICMWVLCVCLNMVGSLAFQLQLPQNPQSDHDQSVIAQQPFYKRKQHNKRGTVRASKHKLTTSQMYMYILEQVVYDAHEVDLNQHKYRTLDKTQSENFEYNKCMHPLSTQKSIKSP